MSFTDFLIIYLAAGAPLAVYFFLQHRTDKNVRYIYLKSVLLVFVWIPYAFRLLHESVTNYFTWRNNKISDAHELEYFEKRFSDIIYESESEISIYDFREVFERYTGLTLAKNAAEVIPPQSTEEIFRVALRQNIKLGAQCLHRRNLERIATHQNSARQDFLKLITQIKLSIAQPETLRNLTFELTHLINDEKAFDEFQTLFASDSLKASIIGHEVNDEQLWRIKTAENSAVKTKPLRLRTLTAIKKN